MPKVKIDSENAIIAFNNADDKGKQLIKDLVGDQVDFTPKNIMDKVKTLKDAYEVLGIKATDSFDINIDGLTPNDIVSMKAYAKLIIIIRALNDGWVPDWSDRNTLKYYCWFEYKSGFGLSCHDYGSTRTYAHIGSRLCLKSRELAIYAGKQFEDIYREFFTL